MSNIITHHMAAMSAAMRMLLAGKRLSKPENVEIAAAFELSPAIIQRMLELGKFGGTTFLALFSADGEEALLERIVVMDGSTTGHRQIQLCCGKFIKKADGTYAIAGFDTDDCWEYVFARGGRTLMRRSAMPSTDRAFGEMRGAQALVTLAASAQCQKEAASACILGM